MSTTDNNKLLAEFMGLVESIIPNQYWTEKSSEGFGMGQLKELKFDTDWNWLMQVVEKIESLQFQSNNDVFKVVIDYGMCTIYNMINNLETIVNVSKSTKIEATYNACVEFVKWYNEQNKI